jgi:glycerol-3-phosphate O-acyltransferase
MASGVISDALQDEPTWPHGSAPGLVVFLMDASSGLEARLLQAWVERHRPEGRSPGDDFTVTIPATRRPKRGRMDPALEATLAGEEEALLTPLRVIWLPQEREGVRAARLSDLLRLGDPRDPGRLRERWVLRRHRARCRIVAGEPATISALRVRWTEVGGRESDATTSLADYVTRQATLALERAARRVTGARYKVPRMIAQEVLGSPATRGKLTRIARESGRSEAAVAKEAAANLKEIAATHSPTVIDLAAGLIRLLYSQGYSPELQYDRERLAGIARLSGRHPVVFLPTHKSNLDHLVLQSMLHENGLPPNHTAGGINMNFFPVGPLVRRSGTFFIRRSFRDDVLYKLVLRSYIDYLIEKRFSLEWYIEGGRSRSGKMLPPRFGMLSYVADAYRRGRSEDVYLIPVSIAYDQIMEVGGYSAEQSGGAKEKESFGWFLRTIRSFRKGYGEIHIRFGEPLSLKSSLGPGRSEEDVEPDEHDLALQKVAFEVAVRINRVTPITPASLVTLALLGAGERALTGAEVRASLVNLLRYVEARKLPTTALLFHLRTVEGVTGSLDALVENDVVTRFDGGPEPVYLIAAEQQLAAGYYRNTIIHFFVNLAIVELSVLHISEHVFGDPIAAFWAEVMRLRDLFKFEFFFEDKDDFKIEIANELAFHDAGWETRLQDGPEGALDFIREFRPYSAHRVLRPFLESYRVFSDRLQRCEPSRAIDKEALVTDCLGLGKQYQLRKLIISTASVSKVLFETALKLAENRGLLEVEAEDLALRRDAFAAEIRDAHRRVEAVVALVAARRAGLDH